MGKRFTVVAVAVVVVEAVAVGTVVCHRGEVLAAAAAAAAPEAPPLRAIRG
jgi:hypothetical protein